MKTTRLVLRAVVASFSIATLNLAGLGNAFATGRGGQQVFTDRTAFETALSSFSVESFESLTATNTFNSSLVDAGVVAITSTSPALGIWNTPSSGSYATDGLNYLISFTFSPGPLILTFTFDEPIRAVGFDLTDYEDADLNGPLMFTYAGGSYVVSTQTTDGVQEFFGIIDPAGVGVFSLENPNGGDGIGIDKITCATGSGLGFCDASDGSLASCPCANPGAPDTGCDIQQGTGGVGLGLVTQETSPSNRVTWSGIGFPAASAPASIVIRAASLDTGSPVVFGDGLRCIGVPLVRLAATFASGGTVTHTHGHGAMAGTGDFYYQLWFRNTPAMYCTPDAFNLSNGRVLTW